MPSKRTRGQVWTHAERKELEETIAAYGTNNETQQTQIKEHKDRLNSAEDRLIAVETNVAEARADRDVIRMKFQARADEESERMRQLRLKVDILEREMRRLKSTSQGPVPPSLPASTMMITPAPARRDLVATPPAAHTKTPSMPVGASPSALLSASQSAQSSARRRGNPLPGRRRITNTLARTPGPPRRVTPGPSHPRVCPVSSVVSLNTSTLKPVPEANPALTFQTRLAQELAQLNPIRSKVKRRGSAPGSIERRKPWDAPKSKPPKSKAPKTRKGRVCKAVRKTAKLGMYAGAAYVAWFLWKAAHYESRYT